MKSVANEIFSIFEKHTKGQCSYDRALEDVSNMINKYADERQIVGYVKSGSLKKVFREVLHNKKLNEVTPYILDCKIHSNEIATIQKMFDSMESCY